MKVARVRPKAAPGVGTMVYPRSRRAYPRYALRPASWLAGHDFDPVRFA